MLFEFPIVTETLSKVEMMKNEIEVLLANIEPLKNLGLEASEAISRVGGCYEELIKVAKEEDIEKWQVHIMRSARISVNSLNCGETKELEAKLIKLDSDRTELLHKFVEMQQEVKDLKNLVAAEAGEKKHYQSQASQLKQELDNFRIAASELKREKELLQTTAKGLKACLSEKNEEDDLLHQQTKELLNLRKENSGLKAAVKRLNEQLGFKDDHNLAHQEEIEILEQHEKDFQAAMELKVGDFVETEEGWKCEVTYTLNENPRVVQILTPDGKKENRCVDNLKIVTIQEKLDTYPSFPKLETITSTEPTVEAAEATPDGAVNTPEVSIAHIIEVGDIVKDKADKVGTVIALPRDGFANVQFADSILNRRIEHLTLVQKTDAVPTVSNEPPSEQEIYNFLASIKTRRQMSAISWLKIKDFVKADTDALQLLIDAADSDKRLIIKDFSAHVTKVFSEYVQGTEDFSDIEWSKLKVVETVEAAEEDLAF